MTFFDAFWYVFNFLSIALVVVFLCMNLTPRFNRYAVFFLTLIPFSAIALAQHYFYDVPSVFFKIPAFAYYFISSIAYFKDKLRTRLFVSIVLMSFTYLVSALLVTGCIACGLNPYDDIMTYIVSLPNTAWADSALRRVYIYKNEEAQKYDFAERANGDIYLLPAESGHSHGGGDDDNLILRLVQGQEHRAAVS